MPSFELYETLGLTTSATSREIEKAYRGTLAMVRRRSDGSARAIARVERAYQILGSEELRSRYDAGGDDTLPPLERATPGETGERSDGGMRQRRLVGVAMIALGVIGFAIYYVVLRQEVAAHEPSVEIHMKWVVLCHLLAFFGLFIAITGVGLDAKITPTPRGVLAVFISIAVFGGSLFASDRILDELRRDGYRPTSGLTIPAPAVATSRLVAH